MRLDSRIKRGKRPLTPLDIEEAKQFIGELCLFSNYASFFENLDKVDPRCDFYQFRLIRSEPEEDKVFHGVGMFLMHGDFRYCLPAKWIKTDELKYNIKNAEQAFKDLFTWEDEEYEQSLKDNN